MDVMPGLLAFISTYNNKIGTVVQLDKAQDAFIAWQNAGKGSSERRRLQPEIEEECKSIAWQVSSCTCAYVNT